MAMVKADNKLNRRDAATARRVAAAEFEKPAGGAMSIAALAGGDPRIDPLSEGASSLPIVVMAKTGAEE